MICQIIQEDSKVSIISVYGVEASCTIDDILNIHEKKHDEHEHHHEHHGQKDLETKKRQNTLDTAAKNLATTLNDIIDPSNIILEVDWENKKFSKIEVKFGQ